MAEIHVPKDALSILDEIIKLAEQVEANNNYYGEYPDVVGHEEVTKFNQDFDRLHSAILLLGNRWCEMDPILYSCQTSTDREESCSLWFFRNDSEGFDGLIEHPVPIEIYDIVDEFCKPNEVPGKKRFPIEVRQRLSVLREKVIVQTKLATRVEEIQDKDETALHNDPKEKVIKPKLTNAGRTLVCSKGTFDFTPPQAIVVKIMLEKGFNSQEFYAEQEILDEAKMDDTSFANVFKSRRKEFKAVFEQHKTMKDCWRLNLGQADD